MSDFFGTDGIRGKVGTYPITADFFLKLGWAVGSVLYKKYNNPSVIIGKDTRISGYMFESALEAGFLSSGVDVGLLGPMPTPAIAYLTRTYGASSGVIISASHNKFSDNGVKFFSNDGFKLSNNEQQQIEEKLHNKIVSVDSANIGKAKRYAQAIGRYIEFCKSTFDRNINLQQLKLIIDTANGATYHIANSVFSELGANAIIINNTPNGLNINDNCGSTNVKGLQQKVIAAEADVGIAFDGDGDRLIMIDHTGAKVDGDELLFIIAKHYKQHNKLTNNIVIGTQMTNLGVRNSLAKLGINFIEAQVGDRFVIEKMQDNQAILGGENSGHIVCLNHSTSGDAIIAALQVLMAMIIKDNDLYTIKQDAAKHHQVLENIYLTKNIDLNNKKLQNTVLLIEKKITPNGRVLIRKSGTEAFLVRVMVEAKDLNIATNYAKKLAEIVKNIN